MDNQSGPDLLSDLPVGIIESILVLLPIKDAIRSTILSTKWRYIWTSIPHLVFYGYSIVSSVEESIREEYLKTFVTRTLFHHKGPLHKFELDISYMNNFPETDQWLHLLSGKDIKELILMVRECENVYFDAPSCLYSFQNLTSLKLYHCRFGSPPPNFKGFLCLRSLRLYCVEVSSDTIESLVAKSPFLENLACCSIGCSEFRISSPYLKYYDLSCSVQEIDKIYLYAPLLVTIDITLEGDSEDEDELPEPKDSVCNCTKFLGGFTNLESLTGDELFTKYLSIGMEYYHHPLVFHHLKIITLRVNFQDIDEILFVVRLIMDAANLSELQVKSYFNYEPYDNRGDASKVRHISFWDSECPQNCTFKKLKVIKITDFHGALPEMKFIKFLLKSSPVLKKMTIGYYPYYNRGDASKVPHIHFWDSEFPQNCTFEKLKVIKITDFCGALYKMKFVKFLLKSSPVLKKMIVEPTPYTEKEKMLNSTVKLLGYRRASTKAKILLKKKSKLEILLIA